MACIADDAGANWKHLNNDFALVEDPLFSRITVDPKS
jgi:hypothetical protein